MLRIDKSQVSPEGGSSFERVLLRNGSFILPHHQTHSAKSLDDGEETDNVLRYEPDTSNPEPRKSDSRTRFLNIILLFSIFIWSGFNCSICGWSLRLVQFRAKRDPCRGRIDPVFNVRRRGGRRNSHWFHDVRSGWIAIRGWADCQRICNQKYAVSLFLNPTSSSPATSMFEAAIRLPILHHYPSNQGGVIT